MESPLWSLEQVDLRGTGRGGKAARFRLTAVSLEIRSGVTAVLGYSGAGKTSLLNLLVGFDRPDSGTVTFSAPRNEARLPVFWVPQNEGLWPHLSVRAHLEAVLPRFEREEASPGDAATAVEAILRTFDLGEKQDVLPARLSQGERGRLALARALASDAAVLVLDEPLVHVDPARISKYRDALRQHAQERGMSLVIATHAPEFALSDAQHSICLDEGRVVFEGAVTDLYYRPATPQQASFLGAATWLPPEEVCRWLGQNARTNPCYRPEQLALAADDTSPLVVQSSRFCGSIGEVELLDERSQERRQFFHRPAGNTLRTGDRVGLKVLCLLLLCLSLIGCGRAGEPQMAVKEVRYWSLPPEGPKMPAPRSVTAGPEGELFVLDTGGRVLVFDRDGQLARQWKMPEYDVGRPEGIRVFQDGRVVVTDTHYHRIVFFDRDGKLLSMSGTHGRGPGQFNYPVALTQDEHENYYICEYGDNDRVQKFSVAGEFLLQFGAFGTADGEFQRPSGVLWHEGKIYVADAMNNRVQVFEDTGKFVGILLSAERGADLGYPYDLTLSSQGDLFVVEYGAGRVSQFSLDGKLRGRFGKTGRGEAQFSTPWGVTVDSAGRVFVADTGNRRIVEIRR